MTQEEADKLHDWKGMSGLQAFSLISISLSSFEDTDKLMLAWLKANGGEIKTEDKKEGK